MWKRKKLVSFRPGAVVGFAEARMLSKKSLVKEGLWWSAGMDGEFAISSSIRFGSMLKSFGAPRVAKVSPIVWHRKVGSVMMLPLSSFKVMGVWLWGVVRLLMARFKLYPFIRQWCMYLVLFWFSLSRQVFSFFWSFCVV